MCTQAVITGLGGSRVHSQVSFGDVETKEVEKWIGIVRVCCLLLHWLAILTDTSTRALSLTICCSTRTRDARGDSFISNPILAGFLPATSSCGRATALRTTGSTRTFMVSLCQGAPTGTVRTADAIAAISIGDDDNRQLTPVRSHLFDMRALTCYVRYQQWGHHLTEKSSTPRKPFHKNF